ncbi:DUF6069 family protein [Streptomyces sp. WMMB 322]|uniref:DUF6069 family protein n=1 Tax=Streptomyces sp. WMMB 322 TaxID=1286821 RepID=UPI000823E870|nr:DUF6069 family protein [Streptomyces sp. WMMB 322]SCK19821.1 hypothetical protein H180DRAFT_01423 [Streptomyces sp. WMMB 322]
MAGPHDPNGPQDPRSPHGRRRREGRPGPSGRPGEPGPSGRPDRPDRPGQSAQPDREGQDQEPGPYTGRGQDPPFEAFDPTGGYYGPAARYPDPYRDPGTYVPEKRTNGFDHDRPPGGRRRVSFVRLWAGGVLVALVAALASAVALLLVRGVLDIPVFAPEQDSTMELTSTGQLALGAALAALAATAVLNLLVLATPQPGRFLGWIIALATAAVMLLPFTSDASWAAKAGTAGVYLVIGVVIGTLLSTVARTAMANGTARSRP